MILHGAGDLLDSMGKSMLVAFLYDGKVETSRSLLSKVVSLSQAPRWRSGAAKAVPQQLRRPFMI